MAGQGKTAQIGEVSRWGGWRGSPNTIANLLRWQVPWPDQRKCKRCGGVAMRGYDHCRMHNGLPLATDAAGRAESRLLGKLERIGLLPLDLLALPVWRDLTGVARAQRAPLRLALVRAWDQRDREPLHWARMQRRALDLARQPDKRSWVPPWLENV